MRRLTLGISLGLCMVLSGSASAFDLRPSVKDQIKIGKDAAAQIRKEEKVLPESDARVKFLRSMGTKLLGAIPEAERKKRPFEYTFDVIDSKEINAFALPGGPIFFYTGLIDKMTTEDQLIGVLAHEIVHVRNQHWASQYGDTMKRRLGLTVLLTILGAGDTWYDVAEIVDTGAFMLPYSRKHESESDKVGYDMMINFGYNPQGMADVFRVFSGGKKGSEFEEMLSTHPDPANRTKAIEKRLSTEKRTRRSQVKLPFATKAMDPPTTSGTGTGKLAFWESDRTCFCGSH